MLLKFFFFFFFFSSLLAGARACLPSGTGPISKTPTFTYTIQPPIRWSFSPAATLFIEPKTSPVANQNFNDDLQLAVFKALNNKGIPPAYASEFKTGTNQVPELEVLPGPLSQPCTSGEAASSNGKTIDEICEGTSPASYSITGSLKVTSTEGLYESVWQELAKLVQKELETQGAKFTSAITVKV